MKIFSWRSALAAAVVASTTGLASAQSWEPPTIPTPNNDATQVTWSVSAADTDLLDYAELFTPQVTSFLPAIMPAPSEGEPFGLTVYFPATGTTRNGASGLATSVASAGGIQIVAPKIQAFTGGGVLTLSNWEINAVTHQLNADITGSRGLPSQSKVTVFTLGDAVVSGNTTSFSLWLTQAGADAFSQAVDAQGPAIIALQNIQQVRFGTVTVDVAMVPEPSSVALVLAGLSVAAVAARRGRRQPAEAQPA